MIIQAAVTCTISFTSQYWNLIPPSLGSGLGSETDISAATAAMISPIQHLIKTSMVRWLGTAVGKEEVSTFRGLGPDDLLWGLCAS